MLTPDEVKLIKSESPVAEKQGKLTKKQLQLIYEKRWFHLLVPKSLGGKEMSLPDFARLMENVASVDGSFAWAINLGAGANMFSGYLDQETAKTIFASEKTCVAGSGAVGGTATKMKGGYLISGHWKYASGAPHANFFSLNAEIVGGNSIKSFLVPTNEVELLDTWNVFGLKATGSCEFKVAKAWVPETYCFNLQHASPWVNSTLYKFPFNSLAAANMVVMLTGLAIQFRKLALETAKRKEALGKGSEGNIYKNNAFQTVLEKADLNFNSERTRTLEYLDELWQKIDRNEPIGDAEKAEFAKLVINTAIASRNLVDGLYPFLGMNVIFEGMEIGRVYRDFKVASQHALLSPAGL